MKAYETENDVMFEITIVLTLANVHVNILIALSPCTDALVRGCRDERTRVHDHKLFIVFFHYLKFFFFQFLNVLHIIKQSKIDSRVKTRNVSMTRAAFLA